MRIKQLVWRGINFLFWDCIPIRSIKVNIRLSRSKDSGYNLKKKEWKSLYKKIKENYKEIRIHELWSTRIGEYIVRYLTAKEDAERNAKKGILDVFVLTDCMNHNARLTRIMGRNIHIVDDTNVYMWQKILHRFPKVEFSKYWTDYSIKKNDRSRNADKVVQYFKLTTSEEKEGHAKMEAMGLCSPFVCISSRDSKYLSVLFPGLDCTYHNFRDSDINRIGPAAEYLGKKGIKTVRMGREVQGGVNFENCIDYANMYYDELLDIVLSKECKFYLGDSSGIIWLPMVFNRPLAFANLIPVFLDSEAFLYNQYTLYIFKKYYKKDEKRFLSINEMMQVEKEVRYNGNKYAEFGIEVIENSEEEILDLVMEMNARLDGEWIDTPQDLELQRKYQSIYRTWCEQEQYQESATLHFNVGTMFLRKNTFLLA